VPSSSKGVPHGSERPKDQTDQEHNHADGPHNGNPREEPYEEKNQTENNHIASSGKIVTEVLE
jgi:hypothetical protein